MVKDPTACRHSSDEASLKKIWWVIRAIKELRLLSWLQAWIGRMADIISTYIYKTKILTRTTLDGSLVYLYRGYLSAVKFGSGNIHQIPNNIDRWHYYLLACSLSQDLAHRSVLSTLFGSINFLRIGLPSTVLHTV